MNEAPAGLGLEIECVQHIFSSVKCECLGVYVLLHTESCGDDYFTEWPTAADRYHYHDHDLILGVL